jgi:hypothetical protein
MNLARELFGDKAAQDKDDEIDRAIEKLIDELVEGLAEMQREADQRLAKLLPGTYWKYSVENQQVYFHIVEREGDEIVARSVRLAELPYGRRVSLEPEARVVLGTFVEIEEIVRTEYEEALNEAFLVAQTMCNTERYGKEEV